MYLLCSRLQKPFHLGNCLFKFPFDNSRKRKWIDSISSTPSATTEPSFLDQFVLPSLPKTETIAFDTVHHWLRQGCCAGPDGVLNRKQAAYLLLIAAWLQVVLNTKWGFTDEKPPFQTSLLLGGPGTGKTFVTNLACKLMRAFLPGAIKAAAFTHKLPNWFLVIHCIHALLCPLI